MVPWLVDWAWACELKGRWFDYQTGHMPGLWARSPVGGMGEATTHWCFCPSLSPSLPLSLKINNKISKKKSGHGKPTWTIIKAQKRPLCSDLLPVSFSTILIWLHVPPTPEKKMGKAVGCHCIVDRRRLFGSLSSWDASVPAESWRGSVFPCGAITSHGIRAVMIARFGMTSFMKRVSQLLLNHRTDQVII